jgi:glycosyltransferase involved in cell wall biosynthesis
MRVLLTTDTIGGVWTFTQELSEQLLALGHAVALVSFGRLPSGAQQAWVSAMAGAHHGRFVFEASDAPLEWMQENHAAVSEGADVLTRVATSFAPDLLHSNQYCWGALPLGVPSVITAHSDVMSWAAAAKPEVLHGSTWLARYCALVQQGLASADAVVAPTAWMRGALLHRFHVPAQIAVIANGRALHAPVEPIQRKLQAVSVGRLWDEAKGLRTLLQIDSAMPIVVAGEESFEDAAVSSGSAVTALGVLDQEELARVFAESSVYVATSLYEPFGLAPLEAALCGCAVVARDLESLREVWGDAALYFHDDAGLEDVLRGLASDPGKLRDAQRACQQRARYFTPERMTESYLALYGALGICRPLGSPQQEITAHAA